jgi:hypothetical protein
MRTIEQLKLEFLEQKIKPTDWLGDSPSRFDTYTRYARQVDSIVEFGVYTGLSTAAFLTGVPKKIRSYDITDEYLSVLPDLEFHAVSNNIDFQFKIGNSLDIEIEEADLLFIDTVHKKKHTQEELRLHSAKIKKFIIFHDTTAWPGVFEAATEFLINNNNWHIVEHCNRESGLLVLRKYND